MAKLTWDTTGTRYYETGIKNAVLYTKTTSDYDTATAWDGVTSVSLSPSGGEANAFYADDIKYLNLLSNEDFGLTLEAYSSPAAFDACDGTAQLNAEHDGIRIGQQTRTTFGLSFKTTKGNDSEGNDLGYILHLVYGCKASPSERAYSTINDSPEPITLSWEITTIPVEMTGFQPTAHIEIDSTKANASKLAALEALLYGTDGTPGTNGYLPLPDAVKTALT